MSVAGEFPESETPAPQQDGGLETDDDAKCVAKRPRQDSVGEPGRGENCSAPVGSSSFGPNSWRWSYKPKPNTPYDRGPKVTKKP